jgi:phytoene dehydrogenase-like protein
VLERRRHARTGGEAYLVLSFFSYQLTEGGAERWDDIKDAVAQRNLDHLRKFVPNLTDDVILGKHISPLDLERRNRHNWHGSCHGGDLPRSPVTCARCGWASHRLPIPGLYQAEQPPIPAARCPVDRDAIAWVAG